MHYLFDNEGHTPQPLQQTFFLKPIVKMVGGLGTRILPNLTQEAFQYTRS